MLGVAKSKTLWLTKEHQKNDFPSKEKSWPDQELPPAVWVKVNIQKKSSLL